MPTALTLTLLDQALTVVRLPADAAVPGWLPTTGFTSVTRTADELSIVCGTGAASAAPADAPAEDGWVALQLEGPFEFSLTGILAAVLVPLADAGVGIFALSTYDTDYVLVKHDLVDATVSVLEVAGHTVHR